MQAKRRPVAGELPESIDPKMAPPCAEMVEELLADPIARGRVSDPMEDGMTFALLLALRDKVTNSATS